MGKLVEIAYFFGQLGKNDMIYHDIPAENPGKSIGTYGISSSNNFFHRMGMSHGLDNGFDIGFEPRKDLRTCQQT